MDFDLQGLGNGAVVALILVKMFLDFYKSQRKEDPEDKVSKELGELVRKIEGIDTRITRQDEFNASLMTLVHELHVWHDITDNDGVRSWVIRESMKDDIAKIAQYLQRQTSILSDLAREVEKLGHEVEKIGDSSD